MVLGDDDEIKEGMIVNEQDSTGYVYDFQRDEDEESAIEIQQRLE